MVGEYEIEELPRVKLVAAMMGKDFDDLASIKKEGSGDKSKEPLVIEAKGLSHAGTIKPLRPGYPQRRSGGPYRTGLAAVEANWPEPFMEPTGPRPVP